MKVVIINDDKGDLESWSASLSNIPNVSPIPVYREETPKSPHQIVKDIGEIDLDSDAGDTVLLDVNLGLNWTGFGQYGGFEVFRHIFSQYPNLRFIFRSQHSKEELHQELRAYCPEGFDQAEFNNKIASKQIYLASNFDAVKRRLLPFNLQEAYEKLFSPIFYYLYLPIEYITPPDEKKKTKSPISSQSQSADVTTADHLVPERIKEMLPVFEETMESLNKALCEARRYLRGSVLPCINQIYELRPMGAFLQKFFEKRPDRLLSKLCSTLDSKSRKEELECLIQHGVGHQFITDFQRVKQALTNINRVITQE